jgi:hypothetical protein
VSNGQKKKKKKKLHMFFFFFGGGEFAILVKEKEALQPGDVFDIC